MDGDKSLYHLQGYLYKMRSVYAHFPINVAILENGVACEVRNFLGEKFTRRVEMLPGVKLTAGTKDEFLLEGNDIELVSRSGIIKHFHLSNNKQSAQKSKHKVVLKM